jgi:hypothetical protein
MSAEAQQEIVQRVANGRAAHDSAIYERKQEGGRDISGWKIESAFHVFQSFHIALKWHPFSVEM